MDSISTQAAQKVEDGLKDIFGSYYSEFKRVMTDCDAIMADFRTRCAPFIKVCDYGVDDMIDIYVDNIEKLGQLDKCLQYAGFNHTGSEHGVRYRRQHHPNFAVRTHIVSRNEVHRMLMGECFGIMKNYLFFKPQMGFYIENPRMVMTRTTNVHGQPRSSNVRTIMLCGVIVEQKEQEKIYIDSLNGLVGLLVSLKDIPDKLAALATQLSTQEPTTCYVYNPDV